eukprot:2907319-Karenia_brevis.AAC.1
MLKLPTLSCLEQSKMPPFALCGGLSLICGSIFCYPVMISSQQNFVPVFRTARRAHGFLLFIVASKNAPGMM